MGRKYLTGDDKIEKALRYLQDKAADRVAKSVLGAGLGPFKRAMKQAAPVGKTKETQKSIGRRLERSKRSGIVSAKVGIDVGKTKAGKVKSDHAFLVGLKTHFVRSAYQAARSAATSAMRERAAQRLIKEAAKARNAS